MPSIRISGSIAFSRLWRSSPRPKAKVKNLKSSRGAFGLWPLAFDFDCLVDPHPIHCVVLPHVRDQDLVADLQAGLDLDQVHRGFSELHVRPYGRLSVRFQLEQSDSLIGLGVA